MELDPRQPVFWWNMGLRFFGAGTLVSDHGTVTDVTTAAKAARSGRPPPHTGRTHGLLSLLVALSLWIAAPPATAQSIPPPPQTQNSATPNSTTGPAVIPTAEISGRAESLRSAVRAADALAAESAGIEKVERGEAALAPTIRSRSAATRFEPGTQPPIEVLDDLQGEWRGFDQTISGWNNTLAHRAEALGTELARLEEMRAIWKQTQEAARRAQAPSAVLSQITASLELIDPAVERVKKARDSVLTLEAQLSKLGAEVSDQLARIEAGRTELLAHLFRRDHLPLWNPRLRDQDLLAIPAALRTTLALDFERMTRYIRDNTSQIVLELLALAGLAGLLLRVRDQASGWAADPDAPQLEVLEGLLQRPVSASILFTLPLLPWLHPQLPSLLESLVGAVVLIPVLRILRPLFGAALGPAIVPLAGFYLADQLRHAAIGIPLLPRALFVMEMGVGALMLFWILRPARLAALPPAAGHERRFRWVGRALRGMRLAFVIALASAIAGYMQFGVLLGTGVLKSAYLAALLYAFVRTGDGGVALLFRAPAVKRQSVVRRSHAMLALRARRTLHVAAMLAWGLLSLDLFSLWVPLQEGVLGALEARVELGNLAFSLGGVLAFVATVWGTFLLSRFLRFLLDEEVYPRLNLRRGVPYAISSLVHYGILLVGFLLAVFAAGVDLNRFALLAGAFGVGIGFGLQNVVNNFVSGLILLFERPVQVGDTIQLGELLGDVRRIGIRSSTVRTWEGAEVIVPNASLVAEQVVNWTLSDRQRRIDIPVGVAYGTDPERVIALLTEMSRAHPDVVSDPPPEVHFLDFGDSSLDFQIRAWTGHFARWLAIRSELAVAANRVLREADIEIPFPQRDLHLRSVDSGLGSVLRDVEET